ncbi:glycine oxidase ThiO [Actinomycetospora sp. TBRC 11914]|uniref:glycine oxidase ThiO n=1 Tax=Actinomycetospora sp. TBRC 11914 TaxID=2729387 RepID=UPI00145E9493|nr:glycine oxidase ThiO [Actinomycetospora sp. TBRC 11914]NMO89044.1 glycine oxidase ThiO [Actinomycetospora sp. TBRC 11914]
MTDRLVVLGAGVVGTTAAWVAARDHLADEVVLVDPAPGSGASWVAGGMLAPITEAWPGERALLELGAASLARWPGFAAAVEGASGRSVGLRREGTLAVVVDAADREDLDRIVEHLRAWGRDAERLTGRETRRQEPALGPAVRAGLAVPDDLAVDNRLLLAALAAAAERAGVVVRREPATRVTESGGAVAGVALASGEEVRAERVVVAAGAWSGALHPALGGLVRPVKGEILRVRARAGSLPPPTRTVRAAVAGRAVYAVPRDGGRLVLGATQYEAGFDADVTVGGVRDLLADAERVFPGLADYALEESAASFRPGTADNLPVLGPVPGAPEGLLACFGHGRGGILLTALTADVVADLLAGRPVPEESRAAAAARLAPLEVSS